MHNKSMKCKMPNVIKGHNSWSIFKIYSKVNQVIYSPLPVYSPGFKTLPWIVLEIFCWQDFIHILSKGHNSGKGHNLDEKKYVPAICSCEIHIWNFPSMHCSKAMLCIKKHAIFIYLFKQCLKRMTQLAINNYSTLWSSNWNLYTYIQQDLTNS